MPKETRGVRIADLIAAGLISPPFGLQASYKGVRLKATILPNGEIVFNREHYKSPSAAASEAKKFVEASGKDGLQTTNTSGWDFWRYFNQETKKIEKIRIIRQVYLRENEPN